MRYPESRYERLEQLERLLGSRSRGWRTSDLARALGVDPDTIRRDLALIESLGTGLIKEGWCYRVDHRRSLHTARLTTDEVLALYLAARLLSRYSDEYNPHTVRALERLADAVGARSPILARHMALAARAVGARAAQPAYVATLETLTRAWVEGRKVRLRYRSITKDETTERTFAPYIVPTGVGVNRKRGGPPSSGGDRPHGRGGEPIGRDEAFDPSVAPCAAMAGGPAPCTAASIRVVSLSPLAEPAGDPH